MSETGRQGPPEWNETGRWVGGAFLIALGIVLFLQNSGYDLSDRGKGMFVLIPAAAAFIAAVLAYGRNGRRVTSGVRGGVSVGIVLTAVAGAIYYGLDWDRFWPVILIALGVVVVAESAWRR